MTPRALAAVAVPAVLAAGCAPLLAPQPPEVPWEDNAAQLEQIHHWQATGRLSATAEGESVQGRFTWQQQPDWVEIRFRGPLGIGGWLVEGAPDRLVAVTGRGEQVVLVDPESELQAIAGYALPVTSMPRWLLGLADPDYPHDYLFGDHGMPLQLAQRGWEVDYAEWRLYSEHWLPRRIDMQRDDVAVRLLIDDWSPADPR